jgi:two-component system sensor histidine kinase TctE
VVSDRLNHAVTQLLSLARNEAGSGKPSELVALDLTDFARGVAADWVERAVEHGIDLGFDGDDAVMVMADAERLREALDNLIDNALKYCPRGSAVTIRTLPQTLAVEDDGPGIPLDEREHIFERFHRLLGNGQEGSGLGLAIVQEIVEAHHATISVDAPAAGGSVFTIRFPAPEQKAG